MTTKKIGVILNPNRERVLALRIGNLRRLLCCFDCVVESPYLGISSGKRPKEERIIRLGYFIRLQRQLDCCGAVVQ